MRRKDEQTVIRCATQVIGRLEKQNRALSKALKALLDGCVALDREQAILPQQMQAARRALDH